MKTIKYLFAVLSFILAVTSCSLDEKSFTDIDKNKYMTNASDANNVLLGVYRDLVSDGLYGYHLSLYFTLPSDIAKVTGAEITNFRNVPSNAYGSTEDEVQTTWRKLYEGIYDANDFIERLSGAVKNFSEKDKNVAAVYMAEARTLRALYYFELVRWYGNIVLMTSTEESLQHPSTFVQAKPEDVYKFIEKDLLYAVKTLPYASDDTYRSNNDFRISKGGALGLLAKVYATWAGYPVRDETKWEKAAAAAKELMDSGRHGLLPDYEQLWKNSGSGKWDATESLIEVSFYSPTITGNSSYDSSGRIGKWNGVTAPDGSIEAIRMAANWRVIPTFAQNWKDYKNDKRWKLSIADYKYVKGEDGPRPVMTYKEKVKDPVTGIESEVTRDGSIEMAMAEDAKPEWRKPFNDGLCPAKWDLEKYAKDNVLIDANMSNVNWYILRYADVLLLYAEAVNESVGPTTEAYEAVNMVRRRAYGFDVNKANAACDLPFGDKETFRQAIRDERAYELAFEGHRRQDLIRWGIFFNTVQDTFKGLNQWHEAASDYYQAFYYTIEGKNELLPIPQRDKDLCTQFQQNPKW